LWAFLRGVLGKGLVLTWCFDGEVVVECVVDVVIYLRYFELPKMRQS